MIHRLTVKFLMMSLDQIRALVCTEIAEHCLAGKYKNLFKSRKQAQSIRMQRHHKLNKKLLDKS